MKAPCPSDEMNPPGSCEGCQWQGVQPRGECRPIGGLKWHRIKLPDMARSDIPAKEQLIGQPSIPIESKFNSVIRKCNLGHIGDLETVSIATTVLESWEVEPFSVE